MNGRRKPRALNPFLVWLCGACALALSGALAAAPDGAPPNRLDITVEPAQPLLERTLYGQALNCDFRFRNTGTDALVLRQVDFVVRDASGAVIAKLELNDNGVAPGVETIPQRKIEPGAGLTLFNPFHTLAAQWPLAALDYEFHFLDAQERDVSIRQRVEPRVYTTRTRLRLPLDGRVHVWDGHDFYSHHRRLDLDHPVVGEIGLRTNASRYSYDFVLVDAEGRRYQGDSSQNANHLSYGRPVLAPGDGVIVTAVDGVSETAELSLEDMRKDVTAIFGNYVVIDHGNGEFSHLGHLRPQSVKVKVGDKVRAGQPIAAVGTSGSSLFPHLHYELSNRPGVDGDGLPSQFVGFDRLLGKKRERGDGMSPDSGDIVEARR